MGGHGGAIDGHGEHATCTPPGVIRTPAADDSAASARANQCDDSPAAGAGTDESEQLQTARITSTTSARAARIARFEGTDRHEVGRGESLTRTHRAATRIQAGIRGRLSRATKVGQLARNRPRNRTRRETKLDDVCENLPPLTLYVNKLPWETNEVRCLTDDKSLGLSIAPAPQSTTAAAVAFHAHS